MIDLRLGDSREVLPFFKENTFSSVVTDPPYELGIMEKAWDSTGIAYDVDFWKKVLFVTRPGAFLLAFSGTRTYHRMASAIENAGFEIKELMFWVFASGMPKYPDISRSIDKKFGHKRENQIDPPITEEAAKWDGWNGGLKPACEPICVARKPLSEKTLVDNVMKWGTGAMNIDASRIPHSSTDSSLPEGERGAALGRYPSNVLFDEEAAKMLDAQTGILKSGKGNVRRKEGKFLDHKGEKAGVTQISYGDSGGASRFFYCNKASKSERGEGNDHTTVKPIKLIEYLVRLVTPPDGVVLDPFMGSGTTGIACRNLGFSFVGVEKEEHYYHISDCRIHDKPIVSTES